MTSVLSTISQHFSKSLILGTFLPTMVFVVLGLIILLPLFPGVGQPADVSLVARLREIGNLDTKDLVLLSLVTVVLSGLVYNFNIPIMRLYEGYRWRGSILGKRLTLHYQRQFDNIRVRQQGMTVIRDLLATGPSNDRIAKFQARLNRLSQRLINEFPSSRSSVLPTRLGNVVHSFEDYPGRQYGISALTIWPRLIARIDKDYAASIDDSKVALDFMMNGSALSAVFAVLMLLAGLVYRLPLRTPGSLMIWLLEVVALAGLSHLLYRGSINRAAGYGAKIKAAFDLYRWDLLKQFGYTRIPTTIANERALWENISRFFIYGEPPKHRARLADYSVGSTSADHTRTMMIDTLRGVVSPSSNTSEVTVKIKITNLSDRDTAKGIVVTDSLPEGFQYIWDSAVVDSGTVKVFGSNPFRFVFDDLPARESKTLEYRALPVK